MGDVSHKNEAINEGMEIIELHRRENESASINKGTNILQARRGKVREFIGEGSNCGLTVNEKEGEAGFAEDIEREYWGKGKMKERVFNDGGSSHLNLLGPGIVEIEAETGFTVEEGKKAGLESGSDEIFEIEDFLVVMIDVNNGDSDRRYARRERKQLVLQGLNEGSPAASISYRFGNSNGAVFTIYRRGCGAEILANKLTVSVFYEKVVRRRNEVDNFVEIQSIMGSKREDSSKNKIRVSSNTVQVGKENVVKNGVTTAICVMVEKKDENSYRRANDQKVQDATEDQLVVAEGWTGLNKKESEKFDRLLDGMGLKMTQLDSKGKRGERKRIGPRSIMGQLS
ncbi:hypothetical protein LguiB_006614 [Lonicera macranthoides]